MLNKVKNISQTGAEEGTIARKPLRVFVHLAHGYDSESWAKSYDNGELIGINERRPYGFHRADKEACQVTYSVDVAENSWQKLTRLVFRAAFGFDMVHAWRNRSRMRQADVIWTYTESQHLGAAACFLMANKDNKPKLIASSIWLFDRWANLTVFHRWLFKRLMNRADILTVHSPENLRVARSLMPHKRSELVRFGIRADDMREPKEKEIKDRPIRIAALGNDRHRDWETLIEAVRSLKCCEVRIVSQTIKRQRVVGLPNVRLMRISHNNQLCELYDWADIIVVPLKQNLHASGNTVMQEATLRGLPVISNNVGGITAYFSERQAEYVPPGEPAALRQAILDLAADSQKRVRMARNAQSAMGPNGLSSVAFVRKHVEFSQELLSLQTN